MGTGFTEVQIEAVLKCSSIEAMVAIQKEYMAKAKDKNDPFRLWDLAIVFTKTMIRELRVMQETCHEVLTELEVSRMTHYSMLLWSLERIALSDAYFIEKKLYPNIDFYSGITLKAMGFPTSMFTVLFALARTVGWVAQWNEMIEDPSQKIGRPRQLYTGYTERDYKPADQR